MSAYGGKPRPSYRRMLADISDGTINAVVVWHQDRLVRQPRELEEFFDICDRAGMTALASVSGDVDLSTHDGRLMARIMGAVARKSSDDMSRRLQRKALEIASEGGVSGGGTRPFGFETDRMTIRPAEADVICELVDRLLSGESLRALCIDLDRRGVRSPAGTTWKPTPLRRMLRSARISGQREHRGQIVAVAKWPAIISREQTTRVRALFANPARQATQPPRRYLLKGLLRCHGCGAALVARPREDGERRYVCARGPQYSGCGRTYVLSEPVEQFVTEAVLWRLDTPALDQAIKDRTRSSGDDVQTQADQLTAKLDDLAQAYAGDAITMSEWMTAREGLQRRLTSLERRMRSDTSVAILRPYAASQGALRRQWPSLDLERRHGIISAVLSHATVGPGRRGLNKFDADRLDLVWRF